MSEEYSITIDLISSDIPPMRSEPNPVREAWLKQVQAIEAEARKSPFYCIDKKVYHITYQMCRETNDNGDFTGEFKPAMLARKLLEEEEFKTDYQTGILYYYNGKSWVPNAEPYLEKMVARILKNDNRVSHFNNILHALKGLTYSKIEFSKKIACENGLLDVETQTLSEFNDKEMPFHSLNIKYDPAATCPNWEEFIKQIVYSDDLLTIQEWSGFLLLPDYRFHKLLWIQGEGRNGKGVWQRTMEAILGSSNVSSLGLEEFDGNHRFALMQLHGKLFNPCSEPNTNRSLQTPLLKKATGQDTIEAEIKGKQARLSFRNCAKITVLANKFPKVNDQTVAFRERRLFVRCPNEFIGEKQKQNIEANWLTINDERSGILNWMLVGLKRLLAQGHFTESKTQQETEAEFLRASDTIGAFIKEMIIFNKTHVTTRSELFESYKNYCDVLGIETENEKKFTARIKETPRVSVTKVHKPKQERAWKGITLKQIDDEGKIKENKETGTISTDSTHVYSPLNSQEKQEINPEYSHVPSVQNVPNQPTIQDQNNKNSDPRTQTRLLDCERVEACYRFICRQQTELDGPVPICIIEDKDAFKALLKEGRIFNSNLPDHVGAC